MQEAAALFTVFEVPSAMIPHMYRHPMIQLFALTALPAVDAAC